MTLEDILKSAKASISERLTSPLISSFLIAWSIWNYKFMIIVLSKASVADTFALINTECFPTSKSIIMRGIFYPLLSSIAYVFIYPIPALIVYRYTLNRQKISNQVKQQIEDQMLLSVEESRALREEFRLRVSEMTGKIADLQQELSDVRKSKSTKEQFVNSLSSIDIESYSQVKDSITDSQAEVLIELGRNDGQMDNDLLVRTLRHKNAKLNRVQIDYDINALAGRSLFERGPLGEIRLTQAGRAEYLSRVNK